jgi:hypothetical protein
MCSDRDAQGGTELGVVGDGGVELDCGEGERS